MLSMDIDEMKKIEEMFKHHIGVMSEDFQHKLDIVVEGHQKLSEKIDRVELTLGARLDKVEARLERVEGKVDGVAADLSAHRADTEAHHGVYRVKESGE
jgi:hypothetical protein